MTTDPLESADNATLTRDYYGQVLIDTWFCALVKGVGKVPFDPGNPEHKKRFTAIKIDLVPLPEMNITNPILREMIAESKEWVSYTLASIKALGIKTADLRNRWVRITFVETGDTYQNAAGETKNKTALKFLALYPDEAACRAAYEAENGISAPPHTEQPKPVSNNGYDPETRKKLLPFVKMIVTKAKETHPGDLVAIGDEVAVKIAEHGTLRNYFLVTDDDVMQLIAAA